MKRIPRFLLWALLALLLIRLSLPEVVKWKANKILGSLEDYTGHIRHVHLALWRGAFELKDIRIQSRDEALGLGIQRIAFQISWPQLLKRAVVADVAITAPRLRLRVSKPAQAIHQVSEKTQEAKEEVVNKTGKSLPDLLADLIPFRIRHFQLLDGSAELQEWTPGVKPVPGKEQPKAAPEALEARITDLQMDIRNLTNAPHLGGGPDATGRINARIMEKGQLQMEVRFKPTVQPPDFDLSVSLTNVDLKELNPLFRWQWGVDVKQGTFAMFTESSARDGGFKGYVKPFLHKVEMHDPEQDKNKGLGAKIKEAVVDTAVAIFKNPDSKNVASRVPFEGRFEGPKVGIWEAVLTVLQNAFVKALSPRLDKK